MTMQTMVRGEAAEWTEEIWRKWHTFVPEDDPKFVEAQSRPTLANYFTPRPYRNEYDRGDKKEGFTFVVGRSVYMVVINGGGTPWLTAPNQPSK